MKCRQAWDRGLTHVNRADGFGLNQGDLAPGAREDSGERGGRHPPRRSATDNHQTSHTACGGLQHLAQLVARQYLSMKAPCMGSECAAPSTIRARRANSRLRVGASMRSAMGSWRRGFFLWLLLFVCLFG